MSIKSANAAAAVPTTQLSVAAQDEVSATISALFGNYGQEYQALSARAAAFHDQFVSLLNAGAGLYASAEAVNGSSLVADVEKAAALDGNRLAAFERSISIKIDGKLPVNAGIIIFGPREAANTSPLTTVEQDVQTLRSDANTLDQALNPNLQNDLTLISNSLDKLNQLNADVGASLTSDTNSFDSSLTRNFGSEGYRRVLEGHNYINSSPPTPPTAETDNLQTIDDNVVKTIDLQTIDTLPSSPGAFIRDVEVTVTDKIVQIGQQFIDSIGQTFNDIGSWF